MLDLIEFSLEQAVTNEIKWKIDTDSHDTDCHVLTTQISASIMKLILWIIIVHQPFQK